MLTWSNYLEIQEENKVNHIPVHLVVCDIDDTLIHKEDHLKEETIQVIQELKRRGIQFTARNPMREMQNLQYRMLRIMAAFYTTGGE